MKRTLPSAVLLLALTTTYAQQHFGNEWINYNARYWAFAIPPNTEGICRIDSLTLANAGFPLDQVDARTIQVFGREQQVPIYIPGDTDGVLNASDHIEFYAKYNDAWLDSALWDDPAHINNPWYSLISDTVMYFITWDATPTKLRMAVEGSGDFLSQPEQPWFWYTAIDQAAPFVLYQRGYRDGVDATTSYTGDGEGYFSTSNWNSSGNPSVIQKPVNTPGALLNGPPATLSTCLTTINSASQGQCPDHHLALYAGTNDQLVLDTAFSYIHLIKRSLPLAASALVDGTTPVHYNLILDPPCLVSMPPNYEDKWRFSYTSIRYARSTSLAGTTGFNMFYPNDQLHTPLHVALDGVVGTPVLYVFADSLYRVPMTFANNRYRALIHADATSPETRVFLTAEGTYSPITAFTPVNGTGEFHDYGAQNVDSALVIITHPKLMNGALAYAQYRESNPYNRYNTLVADVKDLDLQFGGGIPRHPLAIRRFMGYLLQHFETRPQALFLIGKSTPSAQLGGSDNRGYRQDPVARDLCLVQSFGFPPSDALLTMGLSGNPWDLTIPVGRLAAQTDQQVVDYKNKMATLEAQPAAAWMKNILHFRGGFTEEEGQAFGAILNAYKAIAQDTSFVGHVYTFVKNPDQLISQAAADSVHDLVAEGVTLMTFFAHASGGGFDITIDQPQNYEWNGRYPMIIGNSCYTGNIHLISSASASEEFVLSPVGAIAFLSAIDLGVSNYLYSMTSAYYTSFSAANYGKSIGRHMQYLDSLMLYTNTSEVGLLAGVEQFTLHGDPTWIMNSPSLPDLEVKDQDVRLTPDPVTADVDSFQVHVTVRNIGRGTHVPFPMAVQRKLVEENTWLQPVVLQHSMQGWQDTVTFTLPVLADSGGTGLNQVEARADLDPETMPEVEDHTNNKGESNFLITSGDLLPVDPFNYAITPDHGPLLQASTGDPFAPTRNYIIQIDTTDLYNSPVMETGHVTAPGGVVSWQPTSIYSLNTMHDSTVFFWRCSIDSSGNGNYDWHEFSFQYIAHRHGWGQAHYFQFKNNDYNNLIYDRPERDYDFFTGQRNLGCIVKGNTAALCKWLKDLQVQEGGGCGAGLALHLAVVDPFDFIPWHTRWLGTGKWLQAQNDSAGNNSCWQGLGRPQKVYQFPYDATYLPRLEHVLHDSVPNGYYILLYSYKYLNRDGIEAYDPSLYDELHSLGANDLYNGTVPDSVPYIFFCQKGNLALSQERYGLVQDTTIDLSVYLTVSGNSGALSAPPTGPFTTWNKVHWRMVPNVPSDSATITVNRLDQFDQGLPVFTHPSNSMDSLDLTSIDPTTYPRLQLSSRLWSDTLFAGLRPTQPVRWQIIGSPAPECAIDPPSGFFHSFDSLYEGQTARVMVAVNNISDMNMDSLLMGAWVVDGNNVRHLVHYKHWAPLPAQGLLRDTISFPLTGFGGVNTLIIEANPKDTGTAHYDQPEQYHFNNVATLRFETLRDRQNPVLDATFDGIHILDGDIVSARPEIKITLDDENPTLLMNSLADTANIKIFLLRPGATSLEQLRYYQSGQEQLHFVPANGPDNVCHVLWNPTLTQDGIYTLVVRASDVSHNVSGDHDYSVRFEVINKPTITEVLNYPNPFTTNTRFVFTLTGSETPTAMRIRIMTISGRVVREIGLDEIGPLHVGRNITEYGWDGRDQFGDKLARGVYLYQVTAQLHGNDIEYRQTDAGGYFTKGFGKMYLLQ